MNAAHQAHQATFRRPQRLNGLGSRSNIVYFVAGLEVDILTKFQPDRPSGLGGVREQRYLHTYIVQIKL